MSSPSSLLHTFRLPAPPAIPLITCPDNDAAPKLFHLAPLKRNLDASPAQTSKAAAGPRQSLACSRQSAADESGVYARVRYEAEEAQFGGEEGRQGAVELGETGTLHISLLRLLRKRWMKGWNDYEVGYADPEFKGRLLYSR